MPDLENFTDEELDAHRRQVLTEQERRQRLAEGKERIGEVVADYLSAAGVRHPAEGKGELGERVVSLIEADIE